MPRQDRPAPLPSVLESIARELDHLVYDCLYLRLAQAASTVLVTADRRLLERVEGTAWQRHARALAAV